MINKTVARRYAQALFDIAREQNSIEVFARDLSSVIQSINSNEELKAIFYNQLVSVEEKKEIVNKGFTGSVHPMVSNFLNLLLDKFREPYLEQIYEVFLELSDIENKILKADVKSATDLSPEQVSKLEEKLSKITHQNVKVNVTIDESLIGGMAVKIGDKVYDGSVAMQLSMLKEHLQQIQLGR